MNTNKIENKLIYVAFFGILFIYFLGFLYNVNSYFIHVTEDTSGQNAVAALNLNEYGWFKLKFGFFITKINDLNNLPEAYTHHPSLFLLPTAIIYKIFGASEVTTRLGLFLYMILALILWFFALKKFLNSRISLLIILAFVIMPGAIYYGKSFELTVFTIPAGLVTWSLFIFYFFEEKLKTKKIYLWLFIISILIGAQMAWFFYFIPIGIWLFLFTKKGKTTPNRKLFLVFIPLLLIISFAITMLQFYLLKGDRFFNDFIDAFKFRTNQKIQFGFWLDRIWWITKLNITWLLFISGILGIILMLYQSKIIIIFCFLSQ